MLSSAISPLPRPRQVPCSGSPKATTEMLAGLGSAWRPWERVTVKVTMVPGRTRGHVDTEHRTPSSLGLSDGVRLSYGAFRRLHITVPPLQPKPPYIADVCFSSQLQETRPLRACCDRVGARSAVPRLKAN